MNASETIPPNHTARAKCETMINRADNLDCINAEEEEEEEREEKREEEEEEQDILPDCMSVCTKMNDGIMPHNMLIKSIILSGRHK